MTKTDLLVRSVLGPSRGDIRPFTASVELVAQLLFVQHKAIDDILVSKDVYPCVARHLGKRPDTVARQVERTASRCWDLGDRERLEQIIGRRLQVCPTPRETLIYFAFYLHLSTPFYKLIAQQSTPPF